MSQIIQTTVDNPLHAIGADILIIEDQQIVLLGLTTVYIERRYFLFVTYLIISRYRKTQT